MRAHGGTTSSGGAAQRVDGYPDLGTELMAFSALDAGGGADPLAASEETEQPSSSTTESKQSTDSPSRNADSGFPRSSPVPSEEALLGKEFSAAYAADSGYGT